METAKFIILTLVLTPVVAFAIVQGVRKVFRRGSIYVVPLLLGSALISAGISYLVFGGS